MAYSVNFCNRLSEVKPTGFSNMKFTDNFGMSAVQRSKSLSIVHLRENGNYKQYLWRTLQRVWYRGMDNNGAGAGGGSRAAYFINGRNVITFYANGEHPGKREHLMIRQRVENCLNGVFNFKR